VVTLQIDVCEPRPGRLRAAIAAIAEDGVCFSAISEFDSPWTTQHAAKLDWLRLAVPEMLTDIQTYPANPGPQMSLRVGRQLLQAGVDLFREIFLQSAQAQAVWNEVRDQLWKTDVAIVSTTAVAIPWEVLRDPASGKLLAESARSFRVTEALPPMPSVQ
jgi:hypothetical protein